MEARAHLWKAQGGFATLGGVAGTSAENGGRQTSSSFHCPRAEGWDSTELRGTPGTSQPEAPLGLLSLMRSCLPALVAIEPGRPWTARRGEGELRGHPGCMCSTVEHSAPTGPNGNSMPEPSSLTSAADCLLTSRLCVLTLQLASSYPSCPCLPFVLMPRSIF